MALRDTHNPGVRSIKRLILSRAQWEFMRAHVAGCLPFEACGLLAGKIDSVHEVVAITNQLRSATKFRMEPAEQVRAFAQFETQGLELLGIFHSHPAPPGTADAIRAELSVTDIVEAAYPVTQVLWWRAKGPWEANGYWIDDKQVSEVALDINGTE